MVSKAGVSVPCGFQRPLSIGTRFQRCSTLRGEQGVRGVPTEVFDRKRRSMFVVAKHLYGPVVVGVQMMRRDETRHLEVGSGPHVGELSLALERRFIRRDGVL